MEGHRSDARPGRTAKAMVVLGALVVAVTIGTGARTANAHSDSCLLVVHAGGIQQHQVCS